MPTLPWKTFGAAPSDAAADLVEQIVMVSRLPLRRYRDLPAFMRHAAAIRGQLAGADGLIGYALEAHPLRREFFTLSVWRDRASLAAFAHSQPHSGAVAATRPRTHDTKFVTWTRPASNEPVSWTDARAHLSD